MHQTLEIYMARKKRVPDFYNPDSYRVFDDSVTDVSLGDSRLNKTYVERKKEPPPPHPRDPHRRHCPQPYYSRFLTANARTLNEPVSVMHSDDEPLHWWPTSTASDDVTTLPPVTKNTTQRSDYIDHSPIKRKLQHAKNIVSSAKGILPVNPYKTKDDPGEHLLEKVSFYHMYNSRAKELMQRKGKLHGCFVWDRVVKDSKGSDVIETAWNRGELEREKKLVVALANKENEQSTPPTAEVNQNQEKPAPQESTNNEVCKEKRNNSTLEKRESNTSIPPIEGLPPP